MEAGEIVNKTKPKDIQKRTFDFACRIIKLYQFLTKQNRDNEIIARQLLKSGTSIGANIQEAQGGQSQADFISKCNIALKEARETYYWLSLLKETSLISEIKLDGLLKESSELVAILTAIVKNSKAKML